MTYAQWKAELTKDQIEDYIMAYRDYKDPIYKAYCEHCEVKK